MISPLPVTEEPRSVSASANEPERRTDNVPAEARAHLGRGLATFRALRHRNFRLFWSGQLVSLVGTWMQSVAQGWLALQIVQRDYGHANASLYLSLIATLGSLPMLAFTLIAGGVADRFDKRRIVIVTQSCAMLLAFGLGILAGSGAIRLWHVAVYAVCVGLVNAFDMPTRQAFIKEMVGGEDLLNAIALNSSVFNSARILGPALAGWLMTVPHIGIPGIFLLNGASFIAVIAGSLAIRITPQSRPPATAGMWAHLLEGFRYTFQHRMIRLLLVLMAIYTVFGFSYIVLMPVIANQVLHRGAQGYGLLLSCGGLGALAGALLLASSSGRLPKGALLFGGAVVSGVALVLFSISRFFPLSAVLLALVSGGLVVTTSSINSLIQEITPDQMRGRVVSMWTFIFSGFTPLGAIFVGAVAHLTGSAPMALLVGGVLCLLFVILLTAMAPWFWRLE
jgi:MFS family permease